MTTYTPSNTMVASVLADEVYHSAGQTINVSNLGWVPVTDPATGQPMFLYDPAKSGYYGEVWGKPNGSGGYSAIMQVSRGTVVSDPGANTFNSAANLVANIDSDSTNTLLNDAQIVAANTIGAGNFGLSGTPTTYTDAADALYQKITSAFGTGTPIIEVGQSLGGFTADSLLARNIASNSNLTAITFNALPYTSSEASADGYNLTSAQQNAISNNYVGNEQLTQNIFVGTAIGNNVAMGDLPVSGSNIANSITIHSTDAAIAETFLSQYPVGSAEYASAKAWLAQAYPNANSSANQAPIASVLAGNTPTSDNVNGTSSIGVGNGGLVSATGGDGSVSVMLGSNGAYAVTTQAPNSVAAAYVSQTSIYDKNDYLVGKTTLNLNGTTDAVQIDPVTGNTYSATFDQKGNVVPGSIHTTMSYSGFVGAVIDTLATQLISKVLIKNNLPASIVATAFASATIKSVANYANGGQNPTGNFSTDFSSSVVNIAGGIAGSEVGALIAKNLGIPTEAGSIIGGIGGNILTQAIVNEAAQQLGFQALTDITFEATTSQIEGAFSTGLAGAGGGLLGSYIGSLIVGSSQNASLGGAAGGAVGGFIGSIFPGVGTFIGAAIGSFIGDLIGSLFGGGYRGVPFVQAGVGISNGKFVELEVSEDNNGNINDAHAISASLTNYLNQILNTLGGTATGSANWNIGYGKMGDFSTQLGTWGPSATYSNMNDAIKDAAYHLLRSVQITGGNPVMMWELLNSTATNMDGLLNDLGIAQNYQLYSSNPLAVVVAIAASGDATQYQNLQNQLAAAQSKGLSRLTYDGTTVTINTTAGQISGDLGTLSRMPGTSYSFAFADTAANMLSVIGTLETQAAGGHLTAVSFTDAAAPTLSFSATQISSNLSFFQTFKGAYILNVTDTAANVTAIINTLQALAVTNNLGVISLTDAGTPTFTLSTVQLAADASVLGKITGSYKVIVRDTTANISTNFATLQALQAAGHLQSITATDSSNPALGISYAQYTGGTATLALITTPYLLGLVDTGANVQTNLAALQTLASSGKLVSVKFADATKPSLSVTVAQTSSYATLLGLLNGLATITVTGIAANTSYTITGNGLTLPLAVGATVQSTGSNSFLDTLNGSNLTVTLTNSKAVVDASGNVTFTTPLTGFGSSTLYLAANGTATFTLGSDNLIFQANALKCASYANGLFNFGVVASSSAYAETVTWSPVTGVANLVLTATGGQPVTTSLGQVNPGSAFIVSGPTITNTNSAGQKLLSTTVNTDGSQINTVYNFSGGTNKDTATTLNAAGQQTSVRWDHTDGSTYTTYTNPTTQAVIANLTINADGSGTISTANSQTISFAAGNLASAATGSAGDTLLTIKTLSGAGIIESFDLSNGQIVSSFNGNSLTYTLANAGASVDASGNVTITGGGSTIVLPANGGTATFTVGQDTLTFTQNTLQSLSSTNGTYTFGLASPAVGYSESISWNPTTGAVNLIMAQVGGQTTTTPLGLLNPGGVVSVSGATITNTASGGTVISSTTIGSDGSFVNSFNNSTGALHVATDGTGTFIYGSDQLTFKPGALQSYSNASGVFTFNIAPLSTAYSEAITWNPTTGVANLVLTASGKSPVTTTLGQVNPGSVFSVSSSTITNTNASNQLLLSSTVNADGSQIDTVYNFGSGGNADTVTTLNAVGQQTAVHWDHTDGSKYTSYTNPTTQAVIANYTVNANGSGSVSTANSQTVSYAAGNNASITIGSSGDTLLTIKTLSGAGITETLDMSSGKIVSTVNGKTLTYTLANAGASIDASGNVTLTGGGSTILLPANGGNATFTVGQDTLSFPQNVLQSLSSTNGDYMFGVTSTATGFNETISWNPTNGTASLILTPTAGGTALTTSIGQINPGNVLTLAGSTITIASSTGAAIAVTSVNSDGSQINVFYNNSATVNETVTTINTAGQTTSVRWDNANGTTYTSYYNPSTGAVLANRSINADGSGYVATNHNQTVNFAGSNNIFNVSTDASGNTLVSITPQAGTAVTESLYLASGQITSTINGASLTYTLASPSISYDASGNLTLAAAGSTLLLPSNGSNYIFTVGQDTISLDPGSVTSVTPNGSAYNFNLKSQAGTGTSEYVTWSPQTGIATLNMVASNGTTTTTNMGYINPGYVLKVSSSLITNTNASGLVINSYAVQSNGSVITTASGSTYSWTMSNSLVGLSGSDTATIVGTGNTIYASSSDTITLNGSGNTVIASATGATISNVGSSTNTYKIVDTAANVLTNLAALTSAASGIASVTLTDKTTPTLALTAAQYAADTALLSKIGGTYNLSITGMSAASAAAAVTQAHIASVTVSDIAANVLANIVGLESLATNGELASITLTDTATPTMALTATQYAADTAALAKITSAYNLTVSGVTAATASTVASDSHVTSLTVSDTGANIVANIAALQTLAGGTKLSSIMLTDASTPTLALTAAQYTADTTALAKIGSAYNLSVSGVTAANASSVAGNSHVTSLTVSDTAANVLANIAALQTLATGTKLATITLTDSTKPTLTLTWAQYGADTAALGKITSAYALATTGSVTASTASTATSAVIVSDTAANVLTYLSQLQTQAAAARITAVFFTDNTAPTLGLTAAQYTADTTLLGKFSGAYNLTVSGVTAANASTVAGNTHVTSLTVSDTGANVVANIAALQTLATGTKMSSISLTDGSTPTLALTAAQYLADTAALGKIGSAYNLTVSGVAAANAAAVAGNAHVTSLTVSDVGINVVANIAALQTLATGTKLSSIVLTDSTTPTLALTAAQYSADAAALGKISSAYNLAVSGVAAGNVSTLAGNAHVTSVTVVDTGANIVTNIAALQTAGSKLSSITLTDSTAPTLVLTAAQFTADYAVLGKISGAYTLSIAQSGVNFNFAPNTLVSIATNGSTVTYTVNSVASGYTETISWAAGGKALLTLTNKTTSQSFASSLGWLTSGQTLQINGSIVTAYNSSGQAMNATQVNVDGSQADINYNLGTGNWATNTYYYNAAGVQTEIGWTNKDGTSSASYYNPALNGAPLEVNQSVIANGSGTLSTVNSQTVTYAAGETPAISFGATGDNIATFTLNSGTGSVDVIDMATSNITATVGSNKVIDILASTSVALDGSGNVTLTAPATGFGTDTLTLAANGTDVFTLLSDTLKFTGNALQSISFASGAFTYGLTSSASGYSENISWNPTTGKAILNLVNGSTTVAESLGYINPGYVIAVNSSLITNTNSSGQVQNSIQVNADGSQVDTNYDTIGGTWKDSIYYYSNTGVNTEIRYDNNNGTFVDDFYNASGALTSQTVYNADNILHSSNSNVTAINTTGMTTLDVTGSTYVTSSELAGFTSLTNGTGSTDTIYATTSGTYSVASKTVTGNFNLSAANTTYDVTLTGNNQAGQVLTGGSGADTLIVGTGNDTLNGGTGYTTYQFGAAFGQDVVNNAFAGNTVAKGEIDFTSGSITDENLWLKQSGNDLIVQLLGTTEQVTVSGWYGSNAGAQVQTFNVGGLKLDSQVAQLVSAMASYATSHSGFNPTTTGTVMPTDTTLQNTITSSWHH